MQPVPANPAAIVQPAPSQLVLSGSWTARGIGTLERNFESVNIPRSPEAIADATGIEALDTAGAWVLQRLLLRLRAHGNIVTLHGLPAEFAKLLETVAQHLANQANKPAPAVIRCPGVLYLIGSNTVSVAEQMVALVGFVGEIAVAFGGSIAHPQRFRWRPILYNVRSSGFDALPIVGLLSFLLGVVVAYQSADQLRRYGANIFVADLVGFSMLREFAPLITAIIVAGRSGSAYAAQIGTMAVTEEIDAMRTLGIAPMEMLVLPKIIALVIALPLLSVFADVLGVFGGMVMARAQLDVGFVEFLDRFEETVGATAYVVGIGKAPIFAAIIATIGCFQGFRTEGGADNVGRQTTRSVVQSIFLVIVADALFSIAFSLLSI